MLPMASRKMAAVGLLALFGCFVLAASLSDTVRSPVFSRLCFGSAGSGGCGFFICVGLDRDVCFAELIFEELPR